MLHFQRASTANEGEVLINSLSNGATTKWRYNISTWKWIILNTTSHISMSTGAYYETLDTENGSNNCLHKKIIFIAYLGSKTNKNVVAMCAKENHKTFSIYCKSLI